MGNLQINCTCVLLCDSRNVEKTIKINLSCAYTYYIFSHFFLSHNRTGFICQLPEEAVKGYSISS